MCVLVSARMQEMEREMMRLKEEVKKASKGGQSNVQAPPTTVAPPSRTESTKLPQKGQKKRVAHQTLATNQKPAVAARGEDRSVADDIIRQRQEDEQSNVVTEKFSRLRIK